MNIIRYFFGFALIFVLVSFVWSSSQETEIVDRIAAVVNDDVITLSDLQIVISFGLFDKEVASPEDDIPLVLETLINQKLVIGLTKEDIFLQEEEINAAFELLVEREGREVLNKRLIQFGLVEEDLKEYLREERRYRKIIQDRFGLATSVSLKEIEEHYSQVYVPSKRALGIEPKPMMEILDEIELAIKEKKINQRVEEWLKNLKREADIQILIKENNG